MATVLRIDAAWPVKQPSGVAVIRKVGEGWRLLNVAPSYNHFLEFMQTNSDQGIHGSAPNAELLLKRAASIAGEPVNLVAIDIPLSHERITGRRESDNAISRAYGALACGTHSPSSERPGPISEQLRKDFIRSGFSLATEAIVTPTIIEVYPHPALPVLMDANYRLPYKVSKIGKYWPKLAPEQRRKNLIYQWREIAAHLEKQVSGIELHLPTPNFDTGGRQLKAHEDMLDAIIRAWIGARALEGAAKAYGDATSVIWVPSS